MNRHTPGPWIWWPDEGQFITTSDRKIVAEIPCQGANAHDGPLIAAAPRMLAALRLAYPLLNNKAAREEIGALLIEIEEST